MTDADTHPRHGSEPRRYYGKYAGVVVDNAPPADGSAHRGQILVEVPGILEETPGGSGHRAMQVLAAPAFLPGFFFVPENKAQVWVEFVAGDVNHPIWTGVWYPKDAPPKAVDAGDAKQAGEAPTLDQKIIRTKSGQIIQLDDTSGGEQLVIKDEKNGNAITLSASGIVIKDDTNKNTITLSSSGIVIEDDNNKNTIAFDANGITVTAQSGVTLKCGDNNAIKIASAEIELKTSGVTVKIDNSAMDVS